MSEDEQDRDAIAEAHNWLQSAGLWDAQGDLDCLVDRYLTRSNRQWAREEFLIAVKERCRRIPLGHILGVACFDGMPLAVGTGLFIPRVHSGVILNWLETEPLAESAKAIDLCAGSGAIGLAIARRRPDVSVTCVESEAVAFEYLKRNIARLNGVNGNVAALRADIQEWQVFEEFADSIDLVVTNPPYVPQGLELLPEWSCHHPIESVYSGTDGFVLIRQVIALAAHLLKPCGWLAIEHGEEQAHIVFELCQKAGFFQVRSIIDREVSDATGNAVMTVARLPILIGNSAGNKA